MEHLVTLTKLKLQQSRESFSEPSLPEYAPWDAEATRKRLLTFTLDKWPKRLSESCDARAAAFKGWTCTGPNKLECSICESILIQPLNTEIEVSREALEHAYSKQLIEGHAEGCPWLVGKCNKDIFDSFILNIDCEWKCIDESVSECSFGCTRVLSNSQSKFHRWFCPFVYNKYD